MGQVFLARDVSFLCFELLEGRAFFPIMWKSKKSFEHMSPYLNQGAELSWWLRVILS
jgi:hypothetical protein